MLLYYRKVKENLRQNKRKKEELKMKNINEMREITRNAKEEARAKVVARTRAWLEELDEEMTKAAQGGRTMLDTKMPEDCDRQTVRMTLAEAGFNFTMSDRYLTVMWY